MLDTAPRPGVQYGNRDPATSGRRASGIRRDGPRPSERAPDHLHRVTSAWLSVVAFARLRCLQPRRARMVLAAWETTSEPAPRVRRVPGRRGPPSLQVLAADVAALYGLGEVDVMQLAA